MRADRITLIIQKLRLRPGMGVVALMDEIEASAPEVTLEEIAQILSRRRDIEIAERNRRGRQRHP